MAGRDQIRSGYQRNVCVCVMGSRGVVCSRSDHLQFDYTITTPNQPGFRHPMPRPEAMARLAGVGVGRGGGRGGWSGRVGWGGADGAGKDWERGSREREGGGTKNYCCQLSVRSSKAWIEKKDGSDSVLLASSNWKRKLARFDRESSNHRNRIIFSIFGGLRKFKMV